MASCYSEAEREWEFYALFRRLMKFNTEKPPVKNDGPEVWGLVQQDMQERNEFGKRKYGTSLQPDNGRDALKDAYEEALDLTVYLRQAIYERDKA